MAKKRADTALAGSGPAPEVPESSVLVFAWIGIVIAAVATVTFNIHHDTSWLHNALAVIAGLTPPSLAAVLAHVASAFKNLELKIAVFAVSAGAMAVSAIGTTKTLEPGDGFFGGLGFSLVADSASLLCLWGLIEIYTARSRYRKWLAAQGAGTTDAAQGSPGTSAAAGRAGTGDVPGNQAWKAPAVPVPLIPPAAVPAEVVPGTSSAAGSPAAAAAGGAGGAGGAAHSRRSDPKPAGAPPAGSLPQTTTPGGGEPREAVVEEIAARPRPALESTEQRERRALEILAEFRRRTGCRMSNQDLARALGVRKAAVVGENGIRKAVEDREEAAA